MTATITNKTTKESFSKTGSADSDKLFCELQQAVIDEVKLRDWDYQNISIELK